MAQHVGIVTTGQSPRSEYLAFHRNALRALGLEVEVTERACLDSLDREQIRAFEIDPADGPGIGCYVHSGAPADVRMGQGWEEIFVRRDWFIERAQAAVAAHEADGADIVLMCCAEWYPADAFSTRIPLLLPYRMMFDLVRSLAGTLGHVRLALLIPTDWHIDQDRATWEREDWMSDVNVSIGVGIPNGKGAAALAATAPFDLALIWGYGDGLAPNDPDDMLNRISDTLGCPVVTPNILNIQRARLLLRPAWPERIHAQPTP